MGTAHERFILIHLLNSQLLKSKHNIINIHNVLYKFNTYLLPLFIVKSILCIGTQLYVSSNSGSNRQGFLYLDCATYALVQKWPTHDQRNKISERWPDLLYRPRKQCVNSLKNEEAKIYFEIFQKSWIFYSIKSRRKRSSFSSIK